MKALCQTLACLLIPLLAYPQSAPDINFITTDVESFWRHFDEFKKDTTRNPFTLYLNEGTAALKDFIPYRIVSDTALKKRIRQELPYYEAVRPAIFNYDTLKGRVRRYASALKSIYPATTVPDIHFVVGRITAGGTTTDDAIMIGAEMYADTITTTSYGFTAMHVNQIPEVILHCIIYYNQKPAPVGYHILRQSIVEGAAQFIATLVSEKERNGIWQKENFKYGEANEELLVREFQMRKYDSDFDGWLYHGPTEDGRPANVGTWLGYKITAAYYQNAADKQKAVAEILLLNDFERFILLSGYLNQFQDN
ncbi:MAG TPA: hypothetical protein VD927_15550 [Chryseosolibacter sp.]|nr:hypothetical protein [Chryseosolibacter sp.]